MNTISFSSEASIVAWPSARGESDGCGGCVTHLAPRLVCRTLNARDRRLLAARGDFYAQRAFGLPMADANKACAVRLMTVLLDSEMISAPRHTAVRRTLF